MQQILVVDDNPDARDLLGAMLRVEGYDVVFACDGEEGVARYAALRPALVVADIFMPTMDGLTMIREIRHRFHDARIIAISAGWNVPNLVVSGELAELDVLAAAKEAGADRVLEKPLDPDHVVATVAAVLSGAPAA